MYTLVFRELAEDLVKKESEIPHTAWLRSVYASISSPFFHRPYVVTNYATDLGVRVRLDPKISNQTSRFELIRLRRTILDIGAFGKLDGFRAG